MLLWQGAKRKMMNKDFDFLSKQPKDFNGDFEKMYEYVLGVHGGIQFMSSYLGNEDDIDSLIKELYEYYGLPDV